MTTMRTIPALACLLAPLACQGPAATPPPSPCPDEPGVICTWGGTGEAGFNGDDLPPVESRFYWPIDISFTSTGTYVLDWNNHRVRHVGADGTLETVVGTDFVGDGPDDLSDLAPPGAPGIDINLNHPTQLLELADGTLLLMSWHNHKLRRLDPSSGLAYVMAGRGPGFAGDGAVLDDTTRFSQPSAAAVAADGTLYVLDQRNQRVRRILVDGQIDTVAGTGVAGFAGDGGSALLAQFAFPAGPNPEPGGGLVVDADGRVYVADSLNHRVRRIDVALDRVETIAGTGELGDDGDGAPALQARLNYPRDLEIGPDGRLYFVDVKSHRVRVIDLDSGVIDGVAGTGAAGFAGDGASARGAALNEPGGIAFDAAGNLFIADTFNHRIRRVAAAQE
jgi:sugar lactone lactonase YvrE